MKKAQNTRPTTFLERLYAFEHERHMRRLAELKRLEPRIRMLEPTAAALEERGIFLSRDHCLDGGNGVLSLSAGAMPSVDALLYNALIDLGFVEKLREDGRAYAHVILKKSRLKVRLLIPVGHTHAPQKVSQ